MKWPKPMLGVGVFLVLAISLLLTLPSNSIPGLLDLTADRIPAPPELRLASPMDGDGVGAQVTLVGQALSSTRDVADVHYRVDGGRWESAALAARGQRSTPFALTLTLGPGDHILEARAFDGDALSLPARVEVRRDAPTVHVSTPRDGEGVAAGRITVTGSVQGRTEGVLLELDGAAILTAPVTDGLWSAGIDMPEGAHTLRATALGDVRSLSRIVRVAAGTPAPPTLQILSPRQDASYGEEGDLACGGSCILVMGSAPGASRVAVELDGLASTDADVLPSGVWTARFQMYGLANGTHVARFLPLAADGRAGASQSVRFLAHTAVALRVVGSDAPLPTRTPLEFAAVGDRAESSTWTLDGVLVAEGAHVALTLDTPGDHVLSVQTSAPRGRASSASLPLHAINRPPDLAFVGAPSALEGTHRFDVQASDEDGTVTGYRWTFGDGSSSVTRQPTAVHRYTERGSFAVTVTATDDRGSTTQVDTWLDVTNGAPAASFEWTPAAPTVLDVVTLRDTSVDHDGFLVERHWVLDDASTTDEEAPELRFEKRGRHNVSLRVLDELGALGEITRTIVVENLPPVPAMLHDPPLPLTHQEVLFADASTDADGPIATRSWDFGDNSSANGTAVLHTYRSPGNYTVTLTVVDDAGALVDLTRNVTVLDSPPAIHNVTLEPPMPRAQEATRMNVIADDRDGSIIAASWEFGDGTTSNETTPTHRYARSGTYQGNVTVFDEGGLTLTFPFHVVVSNALPTTTLAAARGGLVAAFPTILVANATDIDGRIVYYIFDADNDGVDDCASTQPRCSFTYERAGVYLANVLVEDDEGGTASTEILLDIGLPPADHPPPTVRVESPARALTLRGDHLIRGAADGPRNVTKVDLQMRRDNFAYSGSRDPWRLAAGTTDWHALVDTRAFPDGEYELVVRATDDAGGIGIARVPVTVQNGPRPSQVTLQLVEPPSLIERDVTIRASAFHPEGITHVRFRIDAEDWTTETENPLAFTVDIDRDSLKPGDHVLRIEAFHGIHESGNVTHTFTIPGVPPVIVVDEPPTPLAHGLVRASGRIVGDGRAQYRIDHGIWENLLPGKQWNLTADTLAYRGGNHSLDLRAISSDARLTSQTVTYRITIVNPPFTSSLEDDDAPPRGRDVPAGGLGLLVAALVAALLLARRR